MPAMVLPGLIPRCPIGRGQRVPPAPQCSESKRSEGLLRSPPLLLGCLELCRASVSLMGLQWVFLSPPECLMCGFGVTGAEAASHGGLDLEGRVDAVHGGLEARSL